MFFTPQIKTNVVSNPVFAVMDAVRTRLDRTDVIVTWALLSPTAGTVEVSKQCELFLRSMYEEDPVE